MSDIFTALKAIRPPTTSFVNDESFPDAISLCPALSAVASQGFRDKEVDEGFMSGMSVIYDTLEGTQHLPILSSLTIDHVTEIDRRLQEDQTLMKDLMEKAPYLARYLKTKASASFKAGVMLAIACTCFGADVVTAEPKELVEPDPTPVAAAPSIKDSEIRDEEIETPPTKLGPLSQLLYTLQHALPAIKEISVEATLDMPTPSAVLHIVMGQRTPFGQILEAVMALKKAGINDVSIGSHEGSVVIDLIV
jgi:hypothetical protein